ncbi:MAG: 30S ribosomal protein S12 methylthiotransferase RimO, partial [Candidatus Marinimicrobia bacterium]|nr:30S ribosomal protein S12 methylthiotransferase RimO [Candidatus Neomarinimicrobiota bacterium]
AEISFEKNNSMIGQIVKVLIDKSSEKNSIGRTEFDSPDIDNIVHVKSPMDIGSFANIKIESANEFELIGSPINY